MRGAHKQARGVECLDAVAVLILGARQSIERQQPFRRQRQPNARGDHEFQARSRGEQLLENRCVGCKLFEVVEHEQCSALAQVFDGLLQHLAAALQRDPELARDAAAEIVDRSNVLQRHEGGTVFEGRAEFFDHPSHQTRLADASRSDDAEQPAVVLRQQRRDAPQLDGASNETVVRRSGNLRRRRE